MSEPAPGPIAALRVQLAAALRDAAVTMAAALLTLGCAWSIDPAPGAAILEQPIPFA